MNISILDLYNSKFENPQIYVKSPGRANIIGEHTDYNNGLVMPFAIEQSIHMYLGKNQQGLLRIIAHDLEESIEIDLSQLAYQNSGWKRYFINALVALEFNESEGLDVVFGGNLPQGGGVSSSSAITCGFLAGVNSLFGFNLNLDEMINLASQAENGIGLNGGIMDQTAIFKGKKDCALMIDFLDFSTKEIEMPPAEFTFYLFNSGQKHNLVETEYNRRRATCENALKTMQQANSKIHSLRDVTHQDIGSYLSNETSMKRCIHVIDENKRAESAAHILKDQQYEQLGQILLDSHHSLANNYEVSTAEIDYLVERSQSIPNMLGSRIMGGGFGGCTINFLKGKLDDIESDKLKFDYKEKTGFDLKIIEITANNGVEVVNLF
jgi:galactokinase